MASNEQLAALKRSLNSFKGNYTRALKKAANEKEMDKIRETHRPKIEELEKKIQELDPSRKRVKTAFTLKGMSRKDKVIAVFKAIAKEFNLEDGEIDGVVTKDEDFIVATIKGTYDQILETDFINIEPELRKFMVEELDFVPFDQRKLAEESASKRLANATYEDCIAATLFTEFDGKVDASEWRAKACSMYKGIHKCVPNRITRTFDAMVKLFTHPNVRILIKCEDHPGDEVYNINLKAKIN